MLDEIHLAGPKVVGLDMMMSEPQEVRVIKSGNSSVEVHDDDELAAAAGPAEMRGAGGVVHTRAGDWRFTRRHRRGPRCWVQILEMTPQQFSSMLASRGLHPSAGMSETDLFIISPPAGIARSNCD